MDVVKLLSKAHFEVLEAEERGLISLEDYFAVSDYILNAMEYWTHNFNYDLESEQNFNKLNINIKRRKEVNFEKVRSSCKNYGICGSSSNSVRRFDNQASEKMEKRESK